MSRVLVFGATSAIAQQLIRLYASEGARLVLVARHPGRLDAVAEDARARGATEVHAIAADLNTLDRHTALVEEAWQRFAGAEIAILAQGLLGNQKHDEQDAASATLVLQTNFIAPASLLGCLANLFETQRSGSLAAISSVAGDRGRPTNYIYGAGKAGLDAWLSGLRARLAKAGVHVLTVKPGFVDTPMTAHLPKNPLFASPETVARGIHRAIARRHSKAYLPAFWGPIMTVIRLLPEPIFKRLNL